MLGMNNHDLKHALSALISVLVSTAEGVQYITNPMPNQQNLGVIDRVMSILRDQEDGSVTQRFNIAILQKCTA